MNPEEQRKEIEKDIACPPVLLVTFNRPELARQVLGVIRKAKPRQLFLSVDGPRENRVDDLQLCEECRGLSKEVDWECDVKTLFRDQNRGSKYAVFEAISWFFQHVESGIILEDDCVPHTSFFDYCHVMLKQFESNSRVSSISGTCLDHENTDRSRCRFSIYPFVWGWATWRRAWANFDPKLTNWPEFRDSGMFQQWAVSQGSAGFWAKLFDRCYSGNYETAWDYPWVYSCWSQGGLTVMPPTNLISNRGFGEDATHTKDSNSEFSNLQVASPEFPLTVSSLLHADVQKDEYIRERHYSSSAGKSMNLNDLTFRSKLSKLLKSLSGSRRGSTSDDRAS